MAAFQICLQIWLATSLLADGLAVAGQLRYVRNFAGNTCECVCQKGSFWGNICCFTCSATLQWGMVLGLLLCFILGIGLRFASRLFTKDAKVLQLVHVGIPVSKLHVLGRHKRVFFCISWCTCSEANYSAPPKTIVTKELLDSFLYLIHVYLCSVCGAYSTGECLSLCIRWCQLWSIRFRILCIFHGISHHYKTSQVLVAIVSIVFLIILSSSHGFVGIWIALTIYMGLRMLAGFWR
ncbi:hypothetical protein BHM03_00019766 [Ensete ventricosum]|uniref:Uncharacterized protein n=1 Tax=Ensete ventricosum TaxID=4639 RepID=A0A445MFU4_ENSVE|nr:hypothetical protein BHM03_00019766 [Ensete ventricosum]